MATQNNSLSPAQTQQAAEEVVKKKRKSNGHFPQERGDLMKTPEDRASIGKILEDTYEAWSKPKVKNDDELVERFNAYFERCAKRNVIPTVEEMMTYTGYDWHTVNAWVTGKKKGFTPETGSIVKKAKDFLRVFDAKLVIDGRLNPVTYIFRAKNYYGMSDQQEITIAPANPLGEMADKKQLEEKLQFVDVEADSDKH